MVLVEESAVVVAPTAGERFLQFLNESGLSVSSLDREKLQQIFSDEKKSEKINLWLTNIDLFGHDICMALNERVGGDMNERRVRLCEIRLPAAGYDFVENSSYIPSSLSTSVFKSIVGSRSELVEWYIQQAIRLVDAKSFLAVVIRLMLGKRPKSELPDDLDFDNLSDTVSLLLLVHALASFGELSLSETLTLSGEDFIGSCLNEDAKFFLAFRTLLTNIREIPPPTSLGRLLTDLVRNPTLDGLIGKYFSNSFSVLSVSRRDKDRRRKLFIQGSQLAKRTDAVIQSHQQLCEFVLALVYASNVEIDSETLSITESLFQVVPSGLEGNDSGLMDDIESLERHIETAKLLLGTFKYIRRGLTFTEIKSWQSGISQERHKNLVSSVLKIGLTQWTNSANIFTRKYVEDWWSNLIGNLELVGQAVGISDEKEVYQILLRDLLWFVNRADGDSQLFVEPHVVHRAIQEVCGLLDVEFVRSFIRESLLLCSSLVNVFPIQYTTEVLRLIQIRSLIKQLQVSTASTAGDPKGLVEIIQASMSDKERRRRSELQARMFTCDQRILNLVILDILVRTNKATTILDTIFAFNPNALLETMKIKDLCRLIHIPDTHVHVLHLACAAYILVREREGALSIIERLVSQYRYPESWRLVLMFRQCFGEVPSHLIVPALSVCPPQHIDSLLSVASNFSIAEGNPEINSIPYLTQFPDLGNQADVDAYLDKLGENNGALAFEHAEILAGLSTLDEKSSASVLSSLGKLSYIGCF